MSKKPAGGRPTLRVVGPEDDVDPLFADYGPAAGAPKDQARRPLAAKPFARVYLDVADRLFEHRVSGAAWRLLIEIDRLVLTQRGRNPVLLYSRRLRNIGLADAHPPPRPSPTGEGGVDRSETKQSRLKPMGSPLGVSDPPVAPRPCRRSG